MSYHPMEKIKARKRRSVEKVAISNKVIREGLTREVTLCKDLKKVREEVVQAEGGAGAKKNPETGTNWVFLRPT